MRKRILSVMLAICMVITLIPSAAFAATGTSSTPSVSAYATKEQLMGDTFAPDSDGNATNIGKLVFGKNSSGEAQEWYILGKDTGVTGDNTIIFAAGPIATGQVFEDDAVNEKTNSSLWGDCNYNGASISEVYPSHYGASDLRAKLKAMAENTAYFTGAEQGMMNATAVTTSDINNKVSYTTTDKLYALSADDVNEITIKAGSSNQTVLSRHSYWNIGNDIFWLRSPYYNAQEEGWSYSNVLNASSGDAVSSCGVDAASDIDIRPAANIDISDVLFASSAVAPSDSGTLDELVPTVYGRINKESNAEPQAITLRLDGSGKSIGTATYDPVNGKITAYKGNANGAVSLIIQGNDGTYDWYYSTIITGSETVTVNTDDIESVLPLSSIDLSSCKIWLETTGDDGMIYAVNADKEIEKIYFTYATKEQLMDDTFAPDSDGFAANIGKIVFGKNSSGQEQEWYVLGEDVYIYGKDNTVIFAASPIATGQTFAETRYNRYDGAAVVYANHYGTSNLIVALREMSANNSYFTTAERGMMNLTTFSTEDAKNGSYYTTDRLYALAADGYGTSVQTIKAGSNGQIKLAMKCYWNSGTDAFWLRSPYTEGYAALGACYGSSVIGLIVTYRDNVQPACNLDLSNVLFASAAEASYDGVAKGTIASGTAMTLRLDGSSKNIGTVTYSAITGDIKAAKGSTSGDVSLVVQGKDGTDDWYYSKKIAKKETVNTATIQSELGLSAAIDVSDCKIWLETKDATDGMIYAVNAEKEIEKINTTYATKEQLMNCFSPYSSGTASNIGKLVFGKKQDYDGIYSAEEWYILGKDTGVAGDNTILFAASPIVPRQSFEGEMFDFAGYANGSLNNGDALKKTDTNLGSDCNYSAATPTEVYFNHYGASALRDKLQAIVTVNFTTAEQGMMNATTVTTQDTKDNKTYTTTDKLYALYGVNDETKIYAGSDNQIAISMDSYWNNIKGSDFWLRSPGNESYDNTVHSSGFALLAESGENVRYFHTHAGYSAQPAANLNLSNVLFASAATAATSSTQASYGTIESGAAMTLRLDGRSKNIGTVNYNSEAGTIEVTRGYTSLPVALVVQGNDGTNDWYYSEKIMFDPANVIVNAADIKNALNLSSDIDLSSCKIWLEAYSDPRDRGNGMIYAINAGDTPINSGTYTPPAQNTTVQNNDDGTTSADLNDTTSTSGGTITATIKVDIANEIISKAIENKSKLIVLDALSKNKTEAASTVVAQVDVPTMFLEVLAATTEADVNFKTDVAEVTMDNAAAGAVAEQAAGDTVQLIVEKVDETADKVEFQLKVVCSNGNEIHDFKGGKAAVTVSIPETMAEKEIVCVYIDDNGRMSKVTVQKNANGTYTFFTGHFSTYVLMTAEEADAAIAAQKEEILAALADQQLTARSKLVTMKNGKKAVKITWHNENGEMMDFDGVEIYRSTKRYSGFGKKPLYTTTKDAYYNTAIKKGTKYYYRVRGYVEVEGEKIYTGYSTKAWRTVQ